MKKLTNKELREIQLSMVTYIDKVCKKYAIDYSLGGGSLLGAIRHKGYIPWDDDIDLMLTRANYEQLISHLMEELPNQYSLIYYKVRETFLPFTKLYDNRTCFTSSLDTLNKGTGVFIDIFPMDVLPESAEERVIFKNQVRKKAIDLVTSNSRGLSYASASKWYYFLGKMILWLPSHLKNVGKNREIAEQVDSLMQKYRETAANGIGYVYSGYKTEYFPREIFDDYENVEFEKIQFRKIKNHDCYLSTLYGDYMQLPPEKKRKNHSYYKWYWKNN